MLMSFTTASYQKYDIALFMLKNTPFFFTSSIIIYPPLNPRGALQLSLWWVCVSGVARAFPGGRVTRPEVQNEEENEEKLRKNEGKYRKMRKIEEMFLSCPPGSERQATALVCVPHGFPKVGSREWIFLEKWGSREQKLGKIRVLRAEILPKIRLTMQNFSKNWKWGARERRIDGELVGLGALSGLKKGVIKVAHPHTPFLCQCPPGFEYKWPRVVLHG